VIDWGKVCGSDKTASNSGCTNFNHQPGEEEFKGDNQDEEVVSNESRENVVFVFLDNSAVELIEQVHQNEDVELACLKHKWIQWDTSLFVSHWSSNEVEAILEQHHFTEVHEDQHDDNLIKSHADNLSPHNSVNNSILSADSADVLISW